MPTNNNKDSIRSIITVLSSFFGGKKKIIPTSIPASIPKSLKEILVERIDSAAISLDTLCELIYGSLPDPSKGSKNKTAFAFTPAFKKLVECYEKFNELSNEKFNDLLQSILILANLTCSNVWKLHAVPMVTKLYTLAQSCNKFNKIDIQEPISNVQYVKNECLKLSNEILSVITTINEHTEGTSEVLSLKDFITEKPEKSSIPTPTKSIDEQESLREADFLTQKCDTHGDDFLGIVFHDCCDDADLDY